MCRASALNLARTRLTQDTPGSCGVRPADLFPTQSTHIRESEICATCHTLLTKPLGPGGKEIGEFPEQVPYQEWLHSAYSKQRSCQSCHMPVVDEDVAITSLLGVPRSEVSRHTFVGGNFFMKGILNRNRTELSVASLPDELSASAERTKDHLQSEAARISIGKLEVRDGRLETDVTVENLGGTQAAHRISFAQSLAAFCRPRQGSIARCLNRARLNAPGAIADNDNDSDA